ERLLEAIWIQIVDQLKQQSCGNSYDKYQAFYQRLYDSLDILIDFFNANNHGLPMAKLENAAYKVRTLIQTLPLFKTTHFLTFNGLSLGVSDVAGSSKDCNRYANNAFL